MTRPVKILGISGSARNGSYNTALLKAAKEMLPEGASLEICDISSLPMYSQDLESALPESVVALKRQIKEADALLFASPEHNYTITALLKNAIEWGNRPPGQNVWAGKPAAIVSASTSMRGGVRGQLHLRQVLVDLDVYAMNRPQLMLANAEAAFDEDVRLTDEIARKTLREILQRLVAWTNRLRDD